MKSYLSLLLMLSVITLSSCKKDTDMNPADGSDSTDVAERPPSSAPGFGASKARPEGTPFVWPAGITVVDKPRMDGSCWADARQKKKVKGNAGGVGFCLTLSNTNTYPVRVELPPGLIWVAEKNESFEDISQNGIIVKTITLQVPAHAIETVWIYAYCINVDRSSSRPGDSYEAQPILSTHPGMKTLTQQLATKKIYNDDYETELTEAQQFQLAFVGVAVHEVESYGTVQPSTQKYLDKLPDLK